MSRNSRRRHKSAYDSDAALNAETRRQMTAHRPTISDPTGITTGRWLVKREVLVTVGGIATIWVWRALPEAAKGVADFAIWKYRRDFTTHAAAYAHAYAKAQENIR